MIAKPAVEFKVEGVREQLAALEQWLAQAAQQGVGEHEVEGYLFRQLPAMGAQLLGTFFKLVGPGDLGEEITLEEWHTLQCWPEEHTRRLLTVFGEFALTRWVYGTETENPPRSADELPADADFSTMVGYGPNAQHIPTTP